MAGAGLARPAPALWSAGTLRGAACGRPRAGPATPAAPSRPAPRRDQGLAGRQAQDCAGLRGARAVSTATSSPAGRTRVRQDVLGVAQGPCNPRHDPAAPAAHASLGTPCTRRHGHMAPESDNAQALSRDKSRAGQGRAQRLPHRTTGMSQEPGSALCIILGFQQSVRSAPRGPRPAGRRRAGWPARRIGRPAAARAAGCRGSWARARRARRARSRAARSAAPARPRTRPRRSPGCCPRAEPAQRG